MLREIAIPYLVVESDAKRIEELDQQGVPTLFGDAANSEVLTHAGFSRARALVFTIPDEATGEMVVAAARDLAPELPIITQAESEEGSRQLAQVGAQHIIRPDLEGGFQIVRHTLLQLGFRLSEIYQYTEAVRHDHPLVGQTLKVADLRARTGASVVAILRNSQLIPNPKSMTVFEAEDRIGLIGDREQIAAVEKLLGRFISKDHQKAR